MSFPHQETRLVVFSCEETTCDRDHRPSDFFEEAPGLRPETSSVEMRLRWEAKFTMERNRGRSRRMVWFQAVEVR